MEIKGVEIGEMVLLAPSESDDGRIGYGPRLVGHFGTVHIYGSAEDLRAVSRFFAELAEAREEAEKQPAGTCGCSCSGNNSCAPGSSW